MKKLIALVFAFAALNAQADECELTESQQSVLYFSYSYGEPYDFGYTLSAIAMQESDLGRYRINHSDPSGGIYHLTADKAVDKLGWSHTTFNENRALQRLIDDPAFAAEIAIETLVWWHNYHSGDFLKTWSSYNGGHKGNPLYAKKIVANIEQIKRCGWLDKILDSDSEID